jgi:endoribonuclease Dicer
LLQTAAAQLNDRLPEAREAARKLLLHLHGVYCRNPPEVSHPEEIVAPDNEVSATKQDPWEQYCFKSLPAVTAQAVLRVTCVDS